MASNRLYKLRSRRTDPLIRTAGLREVYDAITEEDGVKYAIGAMQPIDSVYTKNTIDEGDRVKGQLHATLNVSGPAVEFEYQGSVTNDTHIKAHSDIDLLTLTATFVSIQPPGKPEFPYSGDPLADLSDLREDCSKILKSAYPTAMVDDSPGKSISLKGGSLKRKVDVVISNWWDTVEYQRTQARHYRGVKVFDSKTRSRIDNKPFLHNARIDERDRALFGNVRKVSRLLKSLKYDADSPVDISSYDIVSLAYWMPDELMTVQRGAELALTENARFFLKRVLEDSTFRSSLTVPNEMRPIFCPEGATVSGLQQLYKELDELCNDIANGLRRSFRKLADARVAY